MDLSIYNNTNFLILSVVKIYLGNSMPQLHLAFENCLLILLKMCLLIFQKKLLSAVPFSLTEDAVPYF